MTEKRFITLESGIDYGVRDNSTGNCVFDVEITELLNELNDENTHIRQTIKEAMESERTQIGRNVLKQLLESLE